MTTPPAPDTISALLALDPSVPEQAARLRAGIARLVGWHVVKVTWTPASSVDRGWMYTVARPDGGGRDMGGKTVDEAWKWADIPHFETSLDAALTLPLDMETHIEIIADTVGLLDTIEQYKALVIYKWAIDLRPYEIASTPALAYCRAWLKYKQAEARRVHGTDDGAGGGENV